MVESLEKAAVDVEIDAGNLEELLPGSGGILEEKYCELLRVVLKKQENYKAQMNHRLADMQEYYTIWVHQIKTPIAAMGLLLEKEDSDLSRQMGEELARIGQYVEMALCYLRLDSESTDYVFRSLDLDELIKRAVRKFAVTFIRKNIRLVYEPFHVQVLSDEKWLLFVLEQVLSNALKYTDAGSIAITFAEPMTLCIQDTGIGIEAADLPRIFEKGYTGCNGRRGRKSSGIGLYLCKRILLSLGHTIEVLSEPEKGTRVCIGLERKKLETE